MKLDKVIAKRVNKTVYRDGNLAIKNGFNVSPRPNDSQFGCQLKIKSDRALKKAILMADFVAKLNGFVWKNAVQVAQTPNDDFDTLLQLGYIKKVGEANQQAKQQETQPETTKSIQTYAGYTMNQLICGKRAKARKIKRKV